MRAFDFAPLSRSSVGFDRLFEMLNTDRSEADHPFPPYDIVRSGDDRFCMRLALAGFRPEDIKITAQQNLLVIPGARPDTGQPDFVHQGISQRPFERRFDLADYVEVEGATFENGMLQVVLERRIPEAKKPRRIPIGDGGMKVVEAAR